MLIGSHVSFGKQQLLSSVKEELGYGGNTFMFYTGAPENTVRLPIDDDYSIKAIEMMKENNIDLKNIICHAPYIINLANKNDLQKWDFSCNFLKNEIERCETLGVTKIVLHPGSAVNTPREDGLANISEALNRVIDKDSNVVILLETMAGKGNECGISIDELKTIIDNVNDKEHIGICIDTCHINDGGYNISEFDEYLNNIDEQIGIEKVQCIHINDSKNPINSHKDRHENIGFGTIGFTNLINVINNEKLKDVPKILETPYIGDDDLDKKRLYPPYKFEIEMIKSKEFDIELKNKIRAYYK